MGAIKRFIGWFSRFGGQLLITSAGVAMTAAFAGSHGVLDPIFAWAMAIGFEWQWLRSMMYAGRVSSPYVEKTIRAGASSVAIYGVLWGLIQYGVIPKENVPWGWGIALAAAHVLPIVLMNYYAAHIHKAAAQLEYEQQQREVAAVLERSAEQQRQRDALALADAEHAAQLDRQRREAELALEIATKKAHARAALRGAAVRPLTAARPAAQPPVIEQPTYPAPQLVRVYECPRCAAEMTPQEWGHMQSCEKRGARWRGCKSCKE